MRFSIITPNYNGGLHLEKTILTVLEQKKDIDLEYIVVDGGSTDASLDIIAQYRKQITHCIVEKDSGPASAINKGLRLATGDVIAWLNSDDLYFSGTLARVQKSFEQSSTAAMCFGRCTIVNEQNGEIRNAITGFKELFFPLSCRFTYQCINYLSQPALFFRRAAVEEAGLLRDDMIAAWDYEYVLRLWRSGPAVRVKGHPLAAFRWHQGSISGQNYKLQFEEEYLAAKNDAGMLSPQAFVHFFVRWGIVAAYSLMSRKRKKELS